MMLFGAHHRHRRRTTDVMPNLTSARQTSYRLHNANERFRNSEAAAHRRECAVEQ